MNQINISLSEVKKLLKERGIKQKEIAKQAGCSLTYVCLLLNEKCPPKNKKRKQVLKVIKNLLLKPATGS